MGWLVAGPGTAAARPLEVAAGDSAAALPSARAVATRDPGATRLPFSPSHSPEEPFAASELARLYTRNLGTFLGSEPHLSRADLRELDRYGAAPAPTPAAARAAEDTGGTRVVEASGREAPPQLTPEEKARAKPPEAGAHVGIPSPVAATTALLGGLGLLVKLIADLVR